MSGSAAIPVGNTPSAAQLASAADPAALAEWLGRAEPGALAVYASGGDLPRDAAGVLLVRRWVAAQAVTTHQRRDPEDARRIQYLVKKRSGGPAASLLEDESPAPCGQASPQPGLVRSPLARGAATVRTGTRAGSGRAHHAFQTASRNAARLLDLLRDAAGAGSPCPSYAVCAQRLGLKPGERGRMAARAIFRRLEREGKIAIDSRVPRGARVVTVLARGRAQGMSTGETG